MEELKAFLSADGFKGAENHMRSRDNRIDWYAYRRTAIPGIECECNEGKALQIVVEPHSYVMPDGREFKSAEVEICGQAGGQWFKLRAYSINADDLPGSLPNIERSLVAAWNALER